MKDKIWTREQKEVIDSRGTNLLVSASAGSGKTTVMIERIIGLIEEGQSLENMAVCTFTNAAANDMKSKLATRLSDGSSPDIEKQLKILPQADITTLDSWCSRIIKTYFYATDIDPNFEILDVTQADLALAEFTEEVIAEFIAEGDENFIKLYDVLSANRKHKTLAKLIGNLYAYASVMPQPQEWLNCAKIKVVSHEEHMAYIMVDYYKRRDKLLERLKEHRYDCLAAKFTIDAENIQNLMDYANDSGVELLKISSLRKNSEFCYLHDRTKQLKKDAVNLMERLAYIKTLRDAKETEPYVICLVSLTLRLYEKYSEYKKRNAYADYSDLEHETLKILSSEYLPLVQEKYKFVFVDEYQDINPLQEAILNKFSGRMFFVGDVKQSIYGFRLCDPQFFLEKRKKYLDLDGGAEIELNANFRSDNKILQLVNDVFSRVMTEEFGAVDYKTSAMFKTGKELYSPAVVVKILEATSVEKSFVEPKVYSVAQHENIEKDTDTAREIDLVVEHIAKLCLENIADGDGIRRVKYSDIVVLSRARDKFSYELSEALESLAIPVSFVSEDKVLSHKPIEWLVTFMRLINNRNDDISLASVMLSYWGGFTDDDLSRVRLETSSDMTFYEAVASFSEGEGELNSRVKAFIDKIDGYAALSYGVKVDELVGKITSESDYFNYTLLNFGESECAALAEFLKMLSDTKKNLTLAEYLNFFDKVELPLEAHEDVESVKIMTIHAAKGLEFPFVIIPNLDKKLSRRDTYGHMLLSDYGISLEYYDWENRKREDTAEFEHVKMEIRKKCLAEEMRVLYVAMTRAKLQLSLFGIDGNREDDDKDADGATSYLDWLRPSILPMAQKDEDDETVVMSEVSNKFIFSKPRDGIVEKIAARVNFTYSGAHNVVKTSVSKLLSEQNAEEKIVYIGGGESDDRATEIGDAYHKIMEIVDFNTPLDEQWERLEKSCLNFVLCDRKKIRRAVEVVGQFICGAKIYREQPFTLNIPSENGGGNTLVQGVIDLLVTREDASYVVDYKTSPAFALEQGKYKRQLDLYASAVEQILHCKVAGKLLYSFDKGDFIASK